MISFQEFLADTATNGEAVNVMFEERMFGLIAILEKISTVLNSAKIPHEVIGGLAVLIHVEEANPEHTTLTRDVDLMVNRSDLDRIILAAENAGFRYRHAAGVDMLIYGSTSSARNAVHLVFSEEKVRPHYQQATPAIRPVRKLVLGASTMVISVADLIAMKLTSNRDKDRVHVRAMDAAGLITSEVESKLSPDLLDRLLFTRETE